MFSMIKKILKLSLHKYIYYNFFCKNIERRKGCKLIPYKNSIISISSKAKLILEGNLSLNAGKYIGSKAESYLILGETAILHVKGNINIRYGSTIQINMGAVAEFDHFTCNVGLNIQCNEKITIGNDCMIGRNVIIYDSAYHPTGTEADKMKISQAPVSIGNHVWLGTNAVVMQGAVIEDGAIIGTNSTVRGFIPAASFVVGSEDRPSISGMLWARSEDSVQDALKYAKLINEKKIVVDEELVASNKKRIISLLTEHMGKLDYETQKHLVDDKVFDSLSLLTIVALLQGEFQVKIPFTKVNARNFNSVDAMATLMAELSEGSIDTIKTVSHGSKKISLQPLKLNVHETEKPVIQRIMEYAAQNPNDSAIIANDKITRFSELTDMILKINAWLAQMGVKTGNCVAVQAIHEDICIACYYAVHLAGAKLVPMEKSASIARIKEIAEETESSLIIAIKGEQSTGIPWADYDGVRYMVQNSENIERTDICYPDIDLPCEMIFTTGTTGKSKGVLMTHRHISWYAYSVAKCVKMKKGNRFFITTPLNHAGGLRRTHLSLANGCCVVYLDGLSDLGKYFNYIEKYNVTSLYLPPVAIRILLTRTGDELSKYQDQIDFVYSSSSPLPEGDCKALAELLPNSRLYNAYEASETPGVSAYDYNTEKVLKNCMGEANEGVALGILAENDQIITNQASEGQICVKSKMNMKEYYREPELTAAVWKGDWFVSNDLGTMDAEGRVYYHGRKGDVINIGGYKIAPTDVEEVALMSGLINECICVESTDQYGIPYIKLIVVVDEPKSFQEQGLIDYLAGKLEAYKLPRKIETAEKIEKTFNGKINRKAYR